MNSFMNSAKSLLAKVFAKKSPQEIEAKRKRNAAKLEDKRAERAIERRRRNARMESYKEH